MYLSVKHVEGEELILHADVHHLRAALQRNALVTVIVQREKQRMRNIYSQYTVNIQVNI